MNRKILFLLLFLGVALLLVGCQPTCQPWALVAPEQISPPMWGVINTLTPTLTWTYPSVFYPPGYPPPYYTASNCVPERYRVRLSTGPFFTDNLGGETSGPATSWTPSSPLQPGTEYGWIVQGVVGTTAGPPAGYRYFFTGPICETAALVAPVLLDPPDGAVIHDDYPSLIWDYPEDCIPEGYRVDLSTDPSFADTSLSGGTGNPSTRWGPGEHLEDCTTYYWRVAPINGTTLGPFSGTFSFRVEMGFCLGEGSASISGIVWHDLCSLPEIGPLPIPLPAGCVSDGMGSAHANGIREPGEPGIPGVVVGLGPGPCPSYDLLTATTDANGIFIFAGLPAGDFCIFVAAENPPNNGILLPGLWTFPTSGKPGMSFWAIVLAEGEALTDIDFGWDYQFLPPYVAPPRPTFIPTLTPTPKVKCGQYTDQQSCERHPECKWVTSPTQQRGYCKNR